MWHITNRSLVASVRLAHVSCNNQGFLLWAFMSIDNEIMCRHDGHTPNISIVMRFVTSSTLQLTKKQINPIFRL
jgi:hypothetical protein